MLTGSAGNLSTVWHICKKKKNVWSLERTIGLSYWKFDGWPTVICSSLLADLFEPMTDESVTVALLSGCVSINFALGLRSEKQTGKR